MVLPLKRVIGHLEPEQVLTFDVHTAKEGKLFYMLPPKKSAKNLKEILVSFLISFLCVITFNLPVSPFYYFALDSCDLQTRVGRSTLAAEKIISL